MLPRMMVLLLVVWRMAMVVVIVTVVITTASTVVVIIIIIVVGHIGRLHWSSCLSCALRSNPRRGISASTTSRSLRHIGPM